MELFVVFLLEQIGALLNPEEEIDIIALAIADMAEESIPCAGPIPADTLFNRAFNLGEFNGIVTMYHDQGQIALKLLGFEKGVSIEGGTLPQCHLVSK